MPNRYANMTPSERAATRLALHAIDANSVGAGTYVRLLSSALAISVSAAGELLADSDTRLGALRDALSE